MCPFAQEELRLRLGYTSLRFPSFPCFPRFPKGFYYFSEGFRILGNQLHLGNPKVVREVSHFFKQRSKKTLFLPKDRASFTLPFHVIWSLVNYCFGNKIFVGIVFVENLVVAVDHHGQDTFTSDFIIIYYVPLKSRIYQKMQREKPYSS